MYDDGKKKKGIMGVVITIIILILLVVFSNSKVEKWYQIFSPVTSFVNGTQNGIIYLKNKVSGNKDFFINVEELKKENENLKNENLQLQQTLRELEVLKAENATLSEYVNLSDKYSNFTTVPGYVIQSDITNYGKIIVINVGKENGIDVNMPVISEKGLVRVCNICFR